MSETPWLYGGARGTGRGFSPVDYVLLSQIIRAWLAECSYSMDEMVQARTLLDHIERSLEPFAVTDGAR